MGRNFDPSALLVEAQNNTAIMEDGRAIPQEVKQVFI